MEHFVESSAVSTPATPTDTDAFAILKELVELTKLKAEYDAKPHMHHVYWMEAKLVDYKKRWPVAWARAELAVANPGIRPAD